MNSEIFSRLMILAKYCAFEIIKYKYIKIVSHIDTDGISSASIIYKCLKRKNINCEVKFIKKLDERILNELKLENQKLIIFTDLGSTYIDYIIKLNLNCIILDHHEINGKKENIKKMIYLLNPHLFGYNGSFEVSGSGISYILASQLGKNNDLIPLAIVGAIGDMQNQKYRKLIGINREILNIGIQNKMVQASLDLSFFGKQTRKLYKVLQYSSDLYLPELTGNEKNCINFIRKICNKYNKYDNIYWYNLSLIQKKKLLSELILYCLKYGMKSYKIERLIKESYTFINEEYGKEMKDASEYSTLLNSTGRYDNPEIGLQICIGNRENNYNIAKVMLQKHRINIINGLNYVKKIGLNQFENIQYFHSKDQIKDTLIGIIAGIIINIKKYSSKPILAFSFSNEDVKVSSRATNDLIKKGVNLSDAINKTILITGGSGGGHDIAAGATIKKDRIDLFIKVFNYIIESQLQNND